LIVRNLLLFLGLAVVSIAAQQLVSGDDRRDLSYILQSIGYALIVAGIVSLIFLVPGLLFLAAAEGKLSAGLLYVVAVVVSALAFAPFLSITNGDVADVISLAVGALAYAALIRLPALRDLRRLRPLARR
jgi:hypothetical protein